TLVDVTHLVPPGSVRAGAYHLGRTWHRFPAGTVHLAVVDPGVGTSRAGVALAAGGHHFVGPDNGLLSPVLGQATAVVRLAEPAEAAPTFHGRDVFGPAAARLAMGYPLATLGAPYAGTPARLPAHEIRYEGKVVIGQVIHEDRFGTLVTDLTAEDVPPYAVVFVGDFEVGPLRRTFGDVASGGLLAFVGSAGMVEVAVRDGSAARRLGAGVGNEVRARLG
ncbi:MAG: SAM-dependent chlorinase/fluorinase, partial [Gemmatimonadales bacterium]|nr:SAM-dependent chlorinase/fluorinase [Gemmatimonadales bacterium]